MTSREAVIQAHIELGMDREDAERAASWANAIFPDGGVLTQSPVQPGQEREFIEILKTFFRQIDANPKEVLACLQVEMAKRARKN